MMRDTRISHALKDKSYLLCGGRKGLSKDLTTWGAKGKDWEGRGVVFNGDGVIARRKVKCARTDKAREAVWEDDEQMGQKQRNKGTVSLPA